MINGVNIFVFLAFVCTGIHAQWIVSKIHENVVPTTESYWVVRTKARVNRPAFPAYIRFYNKHTAQSEYEIDCSTSDQILYNNNAGDNPHDVIFLTKDHVWSPGDYYITLDEGVLFSNKIEKSMEQLHPTFWQFTAVVQRPQS